MRFLVFVAIICAAFPSSAQTPAVPLLNELKAKREKLPGLHQEFDVSTTTKNARCSGCTPAISQSVRTSLRHVVIDLSHELWREKSVSGSATHVTIFDGKDLFHMEDQGDEYVRKKRGEKDADPIAFPYDFGKPVWEKAVTGRPQPCGLQGTGHECVVIDVPLQQWIRTGVHGYNSKMLEGSTRMIFDPGTGAVVSSRTIQTIESGRSVSQTDTICTLKRMSYGAAMDASFFRLPGGLQEVKELSRWNAAKIKKQLAGKTAPELSMTDLKGHSLSLSTFKGKTVLLDFWATWCGPCRADGPALEKLFRKYGEKDLIIVGISVSEEREIVENFLNQHPHSYPIALTSENELPLPYQISVFPTYIVIDRDGTVTTAVEGGKGFGDLRKLLKKAGLEND